MIFLRTHKFPSRPSSGQKSTQDDQSSSVGLISGVTVFIALLFSITAGFIVAAFQSKLNLSRADHSTMKYGKSQHVNPCLFSQTHFFSCHIAKFVPVYFFHCFLFFFFFFFFTVITPIA